MRKADYFEVQFFFKAWGSGLKLVSERYYGRLIVGSFCMLPLFQDVQVDQELIGSWADNEQGRHFSMIYFCTKED